MKLRNYTSNVSVEKSMALTEKLLVEGGASHIAKMYEGGVIHGITFAITNPETGKNMVFKMTEKASRRFLRNSRPTIEIRAVKARGK